MNPRLLITAAAFCTLFTAPAAARIDLNNDSDAGRGGSTRLPPYLQCVPYARQVTGIQIYGDAHTWWGQAEGRYARGFRPKVGAVMAFRPSGNSTLGHVAAVSRIVDKRTILVRHANWSPINGRRGQIEDNVQVIDVSADNDWSAVRVWYAPLQALGGSVWPVQGFIYPAKAKAGEKPVRMSLPDPVAPKGKAAVKVKDPIAAIIQRKMRW
jgi:surface antigen